MGQVTLRKGHARGRALTRLVRDQRGATIVEFAVVAGPFIALLLAGFEIALVYMAQGTLQTVVERSARTIMTGETQTARLTAAQFKSNACASLPSFLGCRGLIFDVRKATTFAAADTGPPTLSFDASGNVTGGTQFDPGVAGEIIVVRAMYLWPVTLGPMGWDLSDARSGRHLLVATSVAKTEPYKS